MITKEVTAHATTQPASQAARQLTSSLSVIMSPWNIGVLVGSTFPFSINVASFVPPDGRAQFMSE